MTYKGVLMDVACGASGTGADGSDMAKKVAAATYKDRDIEVEVVGYLEGNTPRML